jgi:uncharacterized protein
VSRIDLTRADFQSLEFAERLDLAADACGEDVVSTQGIELEGVVERAGRGYLLDGRIRGTVTMQCVRCLAEISLGLEESFEVVLSPVGSAPSEDETRLGKDELEVRFYAEPTLDLAELAAEQVVLAVPLKPLCSESCRGLCQRCGANLNQGACSCPPETDERWAALRGFAPGTDN